MEVWCLTSSSWVWFTRWHTEYHQWLLWIDLSASLTLWQWPTADANCWKRGRACSSVSPCLSHTYWNNSPPGRYSITITSCVGVSKPVKKQEKEWHLCFLIHLFEESVVFTATCKTANDCLWLLVDKHYHPTATGTPSKVHTHCRVLLCVYNSCHVLLYTCIVYNNRIHVPAVSITRLSYARHSLSMYCTMLSCPRRRSITSISLRTRSRTRSVLSSLVLMTLSATCGVGKI